MLTAMNPIELNKPFIPRLQDVLTPGHASRGFYIASGPRSLVPWLHDRLVHLLHTDSMTTMGDIDAKASSSRIGQLVWVDSGNVFDAYGIARSARERSMDPLRVLRSIQVARPFTAFQFQQMLERVPNISSIKTPHHSRPPVTLAPLVVISDLMGLFYDPEIQENDVQRAFEHFLSRMEWLRKRALVVALNFDYVAPAQRRHLLPQVMKLGRSVSIPHWDNLLPAAVASAPELMDYKSAVNF